MTVPNRSQPIHTGHTLPGNHNDVVPVGILADLRPRNHFHHKFAVLDGERLINGSYNWTRGADRFNRENFCITNDPSLVRAYASAFDEMWSELG